MKASVPLFALLLLPYLTVSQPQGDPSPITFIPGGLHFPPIIANTYEPRVGFIFQAESSDLRLDIGNSIDIIDIHLIPGNESRLTFGADFFTWTALRQDENFHFPVDAVDYLFGLNFSYSRSIAEGDEIQARLRWSHISAHLVDGRYNKATSSWRDAQLPRVYSREFFELIGAYDYRKYVRSFIGVTYIYHIDPPTLGMLTFQTGIEVTMPHELEDRIHPYLAYDLRLSEIDAVTSAHSLQAGMKYGEWHGKGLNLFVAYYSGMNVHGEYHDQRSRYWGPGLTIDF